ncbi:MAG: fused MFS/spermidine synthase [Nesterenkonia sp.]|nr:fused MFS/spermidine synthase [Nesterenkonia sp.]
MPGSLTPSAAGGRIRLVPDGLTDRGMVLLLDGAEQSHVDPEHPDFLLHDYALRIAAALETLHPQGPGAVLHLGAGALTLPRWIDHRWPSAAQTAVDLEPELMAFVLEHLPMARPPRRLVGDAAEILVEDGLLSRETFDVVVADLFNSAQAPAALTAPPFLASLLRTAREGTVMMNLGDDPPMEFARRLVRSAAHQLHGRWDHLVLSAPADVLAAEAEGNLVLVAVPGPEPIPEVAIDALWARGPHPGEVLTGEDLHTWSRG